MTDENEQDKPDLVDGEPAEIPPPAFVPVPLAPAVESPRASAERPTWVTVAFWMWVASAAVSVLLAVATFAARDAFLTALRSNKPAGLDPSKYDEVVNIYVVSQAVTLILFAGSELFFAYRARSGRSWARTTLMVLVPLSILANLFVGATLVTLASLVLPIFALVLLYFPRSTAYFTEMRAKV